MLFETAWADNSTPNTALHRLRKSAIFSELPLTMCSTVQSQEISKCLMSEVNTFIVPFPGESCKASVVTLASISIMYFSCKFSFSLLNACSHLKS